MSRAQSLSPRPPKTIESLGFGRIVRGSVDSMEFNGFLKMDFHGF